LRPELFFAVRGSEHLMHFIKAYEEILQASMIIVNYMQKLLSICAEKCRSLEKASYLIVNITARIGNWKIIKTTKRSAFNFSERLRKFCKNSFTL